MTTKTEQQLFVGSPITSHAFNGTLDKLVVSDNSTIVYVYAKDANGKWTKETELQKHIERVKCVDWAPKTNRIATCAGDRNAYVWNLNETTGVWEPSLVLLRIERAATYIRWSPAEDRFAVGSGARLLSVCFYENEHDWWVSKHIKKPIRSTILCVDWHPSNYILAIGSCDFKCRVFSSALKETNDKPETSGWMPKLSKFATMLAEFSTQGWVHSVKFSPSGDKLAWVAHDASINIVHMNNHATVIRCLTPSLPLLTIIWASEDSVICGGHENFPSLFNIVGGESVSKGIRLDVKGKKAGGGMSAMARFKALDRTGDDTKDASLDTTHQNSIIELRVKKSDSDGKCSQFSSIGMDGKIVDWNLDALASSIADLKI